MLAIGLPGIMIIQIIFIIDSYQLGDGMKPIQRLQ